MTLKNFKKVKTNDYEMMRMQDEIYSAMNSVVNSPIIDNTLLQGINLSAGTTNIVDHKLGRAPLGYIAVMKSANANIWDSQQLNLTPALNLQLLTDLDCTVSLYIF